MNLQCKSETRPQKKGNLCLTPCTFIHILCFQIFTFQHMWIASIAAFWVNSRFQFAYSTGLRWLEDKTNHASSVPSKRVFRSCKHRAPSARGAGCIPYSVASRWAWCCHGDGLLPVSLETWGWLGPTLTTRVNDVHATMTCCQKNPYLHPRSIHILP